MTVAACSSGWRRGPAAFLLSVAVHGVLLWLAVYGFNRMTASENARHDVVADEFSVMLVPAAAQQAATADEPEPEAAQSPLPAAPETPAEKQDIVTNSRQEVKKPPEKKPVTERKKPPKPQKKPVHSRQPAEGESPVTTAGVNATTQGNAQALSPDAGPQGTASQTLKADSNGEKAAYLAKVRAAIERNKVYPRRARQKRSEGRAGVEIRLDGQGNIVSARLASGSGDASLDDAAVEAARRAKSSGPPPEGTGMVLTVQIDFSLHKH